MYISVFFLQPSIFLTRVRTATSVRSQGGSMNQRGMRLASNGDSHNPFILQNAIIVGRVRARVGSDSHCEDNDAASG